MPQTPWDELTEKQQHYYRELEKMANVGVHPTVRSGTARMTSRKFRDEVITEDEVRGQWEALERHGWVEQYTDSRQASAEKERYKPLPREQVNA